jgi:single-strand DNA-binding protein
MGCMQKVTLVGRLASAPRIKQFQGKDGTTKTKGSFLLAVSRGRGKDLEPWWLWVDAWGKTAETVGKYLEKGSSVAVEAHLEGRYWNPDGGTRGGKIRMSVVADRVEFIGSRRNTAPQAAAETPAPIAQRRASR